MMSLINTERRDIGKKVLMLNIFQLSLYYLSIYHLFMDNLSLLLISSIHSQTCIQHAY